MKDLLRLWSLRLNFLRKACLALVTKGGEDRIKVIIVLNWIDNLNMNSLIKPHKSRVPIEIGKRFLWAKEWRNVNGNSSFQKKMRQAGSKVWGKRKKGGFDTIWDKLRFNIMKMSLLLCPE